MHVEDYMNETPARLLAMLTQTREDLWQAARPGSRAPYRFHGRGSASRYRPGGRFGLNSTLWRRAGWR